MSAVWKTTAAGLQRGGKKILSCQNNEICDFSTYWVRDTHSVLSVMLSSDIQGNCIYAEDTRHRSTVLRRGCSARASPAPLFGLPGFPRARGGEHEAAQPSCPVCFTPVLRHNRHVSARAAQGGSASAFPQAFGHSGRGTLHLCTSHGGGQCRNLPHPFRVSWRSFGSKILGAGSPAAAAGSDGLSRHLPPF